jgi:hypothetical protein
MTDERHPLRPVLPLVRPVTSSTSDLSTSDLGTSVLGPWDVERAAPFAAEPALVADQGYDGG